MTKNGMPTGITGPSFDCLKANTVAKRAICENANLSALDRAKGRIHLILPQNEPHLDRTVSLADQREWLSRRDSCGGDGECIVERYASRLDDFERCASAA